ncbi:hypothetical protein [Psychroflexus sp. ALD_RP9]|uniref:hypothetical protein n=1 Tax=Psychroflexus sp. ALD_RP9 TaxID=2777186 RepID=UPI001A8D811F|nr:hypothetical protein [Psychroflexus sp. ALD_RP9]QSS96642.1 hypothetical protein IMZ30_09335 [Psychroflexus sp. ALD_RP9]
MNKKTLIIIGILIIGLLIVLKLNNDFLMLWNSNIVSVETESPLTKEKVKIEFGISAKSIFTTNEVEIFANKKNYTEIFNGKKQSDIINEYGENDFLVTYNNKYYLTFRQFKTSRRHQHRYNFKFEQKGDDIILRVKIKGIDNMVFEKKMKKIKTNAQQRV